MLDRSKGAPTLKNQLVTLIKDDIEEGCYKPGDLLPREIDYQEKYQVSRITVRAAMGELELKGYVERTKGKGTVVSGQRIGEPLLKIKGFTEEMKEKGIVPTTLYAKISLIKSSIVCAKALELEVGTPVYELIRVKCINGIPVVRFQTYIKTTINLELEDSLYYHSLYDYLHQSQGIEVKHIKQRMTADVADEILARELNCKKYTPVLVLKRTAFDERGNLFEYTEGRYVASRYEYYFELKE